MSILDSIKEAENQAADIQLQAKTQVRELLKTTEQEKNENANSMLEKARMQAKTLADETRKQADQKMSQTLAQEKSEALKNAEDKKEFLPEAVKFILERVEMQC